MEAAACVPNRLLKQQLNDTARRGACKRVATPQTDPEQ
jgi:hypothetical protein